MCKNHNLKIFILGMVCFLITQMLTRLPILKYIYSTFKYSIFESENKILTYILIALSAGVFEEGGRYILRRYFVKSNYTLSEPVIFGLGHGVMEVIMVVGIILYSSTDITVDIVWINIFERILAIIFHVCMTVIIWRGFILNREIKFLLVAIFMHFIFDYLIFIAPVLNLNFIGLFIIWMVIDLGLLAYVFEIKNIWR